MKKTKNSLQIILITHFFIGLGINTYSQLKNDVNQYMVYQPLVNYASASSYNELNAAVYYRNQWVGFNGAPINYAAQVSLPVKNINSSFGLRFVRDEIGVRLSDVVSLNYAYNIKLTQKANLYRVQTH